MALWALGLLNSCLWSLSGAQRPTWYHGDLVPPPAAAREHPHLPLDLALTARTLLNCSYWLVMGMLAAMTVGSVVLFLRQLPLAWKAAPRRAGGTGFWGLWPSRASKVSGRGWALEREKAPLARFEEAHERPWTSTTCPAAPSPKQPVAAAPKTACLLRETGGSRDPPCGHRGCLRCMPLSSFPEQFCP